MVLPSEVVLVVYGGAGLLALVLVPYVRQRREKAGVFGLYLIIAGISGWSFTLGLLYTVADPTVGLVAANLRLFAVYLAVSGWFLVAGEHTGLFRTSWPLVGLLAVPALLAQVVGWTDPGGLMWAGAVPGSVLTWTPPFGPLYVAHLVYGYVLVGVSLLLLAGHTVTARGVPRLQSVALFGALAPPLVANVVFQSFTGVAYDVTPIGLAISVFVLAWALFRVNLLDIAPIARDRIVEEMGDAAVTIDSEGRVIDWNPAAHDLAGIDEPRIGMALSEFFRNVPDVAAVVAEGSGGEVSESERGVSESGRGVSESDRSVAVRTDGTERHFDVDVSRVEMGVSGDEGRLVVMREITALKRRERELRDRESELDLMRQVYARVLRHNLRNELTVVRGHGETITREGDAATAALGAEIVERSDELIELSDTARSVETLLGEGGTTEPLDLTGCCELLLAEQEDRNPAVDFELDAPERCVVETTPVVTVAVENLLENAAEHNAGAEQSVRIEIEPVGDRASVRIADDGPGIPDEELSVLERGRETPLEHVSGLGLWIVHWIVQSAAVEMAIAVDDDGTEVTLTFPRLERVDERGDPAVEPVD